MGRLTLLLTLGLSACTMEYFTLPNGQEVDVEPDLDPRTAVAPGEIDALFGPGELPPPSDLPAYELATPMDGDTYTLDEFVPVGLTIEDTTDRYVVYYDINELGGWFGPPNHTFAIRLAPYQDSDELVFTIEALVYDTKDNRMVGADAVTVFGAEE